MKKNQTNIQTMPTILAAIIFFICIGLAIAGNGQSRQCQGTTKAGKPCASIMVMKSGFCRAHDPQSKKCAYSKNGKPCKMTVKASQTYCRFHENKSLSYVPTF